MKTRLTTLAIAAALSLPALAGEAMTEDDLARADALYSAALAADAQRCNAQQAQIASLWKAAKTDEALVMFGDIARGHPFLQWQKSASVPATPVRTVSAGPGDLGVY